LKICNIKNNADTALRFSAIAFESFEKRRVRWDAFLTEPRASLTCTTRWSQLWWRGSLPRAARNPRDSPYSPTRSSLWTWCWGSARERHCEHPSLRGCGVGACVRESHRFTRYVVVTGARSVHARENSCRQPSAQIQSPSA